MKKIKVPKRYRKGQKKLMKEIYKKETADT